MRNGRIAVKTVLGWMLSGLLILISACEDANPAPSPGISPSPPAATTPAPTLAASPTLAATATPTTAPPLFREKLGSLFIGEQEEGSGMQVTSWRGSTYPQAPSKIVHHLEEAVVVLEFANATEQEIRTLLDQITVGGGKAAWNRDDKNPNFYRLMRKQAEGASFELRMGELPPLTISRMKALSYKPIDASGRINADMLLVNAREYGTRVMVPMEEQAVTLEFSEPMKPVLPTASEGASSPLRAEWITDTRLRIELNETGYSVDHGAKELLVRTDQLQAVSGNTLKWGSLHILRAPAMSWRDGRTGADVTQGPRDRYYEQLAFAPDRSRYVGIVSLGGSMGDGDGWSYAFVLERNGQPPVVLEDVFYSTIEPRDAPIRWIDSKTLLYASYYGVYKYDTQTMTRQLIVTADPEERENINFAEWDAVRNRLYVLAFEDRNESDMTKAITFVDGTIREVRRNFAETVLVGKYSLLDLTVTPTAQGVYWTRTENGVPVTDYVGNDGKTVSAPGVVRLATSTGVYLQRFRADPVDPAERLSIVQPDGWTYWEPGTQEKRLADLRGEGIVYAWGEELVSLIDDRYYRYDPVLGSWVQWQAPAGGGPNAEPVRGPEGLYRIRTNL